jgi:hypothetical protein
MPRDGEVPVALRIDGNGTVTSPSGRFSEADCADFERQHEQEVEVGQFGLLLDLVSTEELAPDDPPPAA